MSSVRVDRPNGHAQAQPETEPPAGHDECLEFIRFCYRRRRVGWPDLYDEMSLVAARGAYRGLGYAELAERGITFCLSDLQRLSALAERVAVEESSGLGPVPAATAIAPQPALARQVQAAGRDEEPQPEATRVPMMLASQPARG